MADRGPRCPAERPLPLGDNPIVRLHWRRVVRALRQDWHGLAGGGPGPSAARAVAFQVMGALAAAASAYAFPAILRWLSFLSGPANGGVYLDDLLDPGALVLLLAIGGLAAGVAGNASGVLARDRSQGRLDSWLTSRMSAADVVAGRAAVAVLIPCAAATLITVPWLLFPPILPGGRLFSVSCDGSPRALVALLWVDTLALGISCGLAGVAIASWVRSAWAAGLASFAAMLAVLSPAAAAILPGFWSWTILGQGIVLPLWVHPALWGSCAAVALVAFVAAQVGLDLVPSPVCLVPGLAFRAPVSRRHVGAALALVVLALLAASTVSVVRNALAFARSTPSQACSQAGALMKRKQYRQAIRLLDTEVPRGVRGPFGAWAWGLKGDCHLRLSEYRQALAAYRQMARLCPAPAIQAEARWSIGLCEANLGRWPQAAAAFRDAVRWARQRHDRRGLYAPAMDQLSHGTAVSAAWDLVYLGETSEARAACEAALRCGDAETVLDARELLAVLRAGRTALPRVGIRYRAGAPTTVDRVGATTPAGRAGIARGDRIVAVEGHPVGSYADIARVLARRNPGDSVSYRVKRAGKDMAFQVRLGAPRKPAWARRYEAELAHGKRVTAGRIPR